MIFKEKGPRDFTLHHKLIKKLPAKAGNTYNAAPGCGDRNKAGGLRVLGQGPRTLCYDGTKPEVPMPATNLWKATRVGSLLKTVTLEDQWKEPVMFRPELR